MTLIFNRFSRIECRQLRRNHSSKLKLRWRPRRQLFFRKRLMSLRTTPTTRHQITVKKLVKLSKTPKPAWQSVKLTMTLPSRHSLILNRINLRAILAHFFSPRPRVDQSRLAKVRALRQKLRRPRAWTKKCLLWPPLASNKGREQPKAQQGRSAHRRDLLFRRSPTRPELLHNFKLRTLMLVL